MRLRKLCAVSVSRARFSKRFRVNSENRDEPPAKQLQGLADLLDRVLAAQTHDKAGELDQKVSRQLDSLPIARPSPESAKLACRLAEQSVEPLRRADLHFTVDNGWRIEPPQVVEPANLRLPLPLLFSSSCDALEGAWKILVARHAANRFFQLHASFDERLPHLLAAEAHLWEVASAHGGPSPSIPYAYRVQALEWFGQTEIDADGSPQRARGSVSVCIRCGWVLAGSRASSLPPRCIRCAKEPPRARTWPTHAIAPAERGTWWLACQRPPCSMAFVGRAQARYCPAHRTARLTPSKRRVRTT